MRTPLRLYAAVAAHAPPRCAASLRARRRARPSRRRRLDPSRPCRRRPGLWPPLPPGKPRSSEPDRRARDRRIPSLARVPTPLPSPAAKPVRVPTPLPSPAARPVSAPRRSRRRLRAPVSAPSSARPLPIARRDACATRRGSTPRCARRAAARGPLTPAVAPRRLRAPFHLRRPPRRCARCPRLRARCQLRARRLRLARSAAPLLRSVPRCGGRRLDARRPSLRASPGRAERRLVRRPRGRSLRPGEPRCDPREGRSRGHQRRHPRLA
jgi:hypothetical protein